MATSKPNSLVLAHTCPRCERSFPTAQGARMHVLRTHERKGGNPKGYKYPKVTAEAADVIFGRMAAATEVLFPVVPHDRVIEIAELQHAMLKVLSR